MLTQPTFKVATWNIDARLEDRETRIATLGRVLRKANVEVLCLQEAWESVGQSLADQLNMKVVVESIQPGAKFGNSILVKKHLNIMTEPSITRLEGRGENNKSSFLASVVVESTSGQKFNILTSHLAWGSRSEYNRLTQVKAVESYAESMESVNPGSISIFTGDFNATPENDSLRFLKGALADANDSAYWIDAWEMAGKGDGYTSTPENPMAVSIAKAFNQATLTDFLPHRRIDFIMVRGWLYGAHGCPLETTLLGEHKSMLLGDATPSDHYGIVTQLWDPSIQA